MGLALPAKGEHDGPYKWPRRRTLYGCAAADDRLARGGGMHRESVSEVGVVCAVSRAADARGWRELHVEQTGTSDERHEQR